MTDTSACGRIEFHILWCRDCVRLIRSRFQDQVFDQVFTSGFGLRRRCVANRHNATATRLFTGMHSRNLVSFFAKSGPTNRTMYSNVHLDILKFSFHHSSTKFPFNRASNQNWFLGHDHARLTRLVLRRAICSRINRFRLDLFRCCKSKSCCNLDSWVC